MLASWTLALLSAVTLAAAAPAPNGPADTPANRTEALSRYGAPAARAATSAGGERLRWVKAEESILSGLYVTTIEVDRDGKVVRLERSVLHPANRTGY